MVAVGGEPDALNPIFGDIFGAIYGDPWPVFSSLLSYDADLELAPDLAAEAPDLPDGATEVTVTLRDDVTWHDGQPFDADDVVFTYRSILDPDVATALGTCCSTRWRRSRPSTSTRCGSACRGAILRSWTR